MSFNCIKGESAVLVIVIQLEAGKKIKDGERKGVGGGQYVY